MFLFKLPDVLCLDVTNKWCNSYSLQNLDSAICNKLERKYFLDLLADPLFFIEMDHFIHDYFSNEGFMVWIIKRKISINHLSLFDTDAFEWTDLDLLKIVTINCGCGIFDDTKRKGFLKLANTINACENLTKLDMHESLVGSKVFMKQLSGTMLSKIKEFHLTDEEETLSSPAFHKFATSFSSLRELNLSFQLLSIDEFLKDLISLLSNNPLMKNLTLEIPLESEKFTEFFVLIFVQYCPKLTNLCLNFICDIKKIDAMLDLLLLDQTRDGKWQNINIRPDGEQYGSEFTYNCEDNKKTLIVREIELSTVFFEQITEFYEINIHSCLNAVETTFQAIGMFNQYSLIKVALSYCKFSVVGVQSMLSSCKNLTQLSLEGILHLTHAQLSHLFATSNQLIDLRLCRVYKLTECTAIEILKFNPQLEKISIIYCSDCTHKSNIVKFMKKQGNLKTDLSFSFDSHYDSEQNVMYKAF